MPYSHLLSDGWYLIKTPEGNEQCNYIKNGRFLYLSNDNNLLQKAIDIGCKFIRVEVVDFETWGYLQEERMNLSEKVLEMEKELEEYRRLTITTPVDMTETIINF